MVGADDGEIPFGFTVDVLYQIILRPGKFWGFFRKFFFGQIFSHQFFNRDNV